MPEIALTPKERQALKAQAHGLKPVVLLGAAGLSSPALKEIDRALAAHELVKVRVPGDDRDARDAIFAEVAEALSAARVQAIGKLLVLFRPAPEQEASPPAPAARAPARSPKAPSRPLRSATTPGRAGKPSAPKRSTPDRREAERVNRSPAPRRDPGAAKRAAGRGNATRRGTGRTR
jgi:putative YhbY family RNA-binding protein